MRKALSVYELMLDAGPKTSCLWPKEYRREDAETANKFLTECCWTDDEETGLVELIPNLPFVDTVCRAFIYTRNLGLEFEIEKSRRLLLSWMIRGLRLWTMGLRRESGVICGLTYPKSAEHVWRIAWLYNNLAERRPEFRLKKLEEGKETKGGSMLSKELDTVILPNGSIVTTLNQEGQSFQGSGYSWVDMEEASLYKDFAGMKGQAHIVTGGRADVAGGHVCIITNANGANESWKESKVPKRILFNEDPTYRPVLAQR